MPIQPGEVFPPICLALKGQDLDLRGRFQFSPGLLIGVTGAFHPICSSVFLPGYKAVAPFLKDQGLGFVGCLSVNDPYVLRAWAKKLRVTSELIFISDVNASLTKALDMTLETGDDGYGTILPRGRRFAMFVGEGAIIQAVAVDEEATAGAFVPKIAQILSVALPASLSIRLKQSQSTASLMTALAPHHPEQPADESLLPYLLARDSSVIDTDHVHVVFDYSGAALADGYVIRKVEGALEIAGMDGEDLGSAWVDEARPESLRDGLPSATSALGGEGMYTVEKVIITPSYNMRVYSTEGLLPSATILVVHRQSNTNAYMVAAFHLQPEGRDVLLANLLSVQDKFEQTPENTWSPPIERSCLSDPDLGLDLAHFVWAFAKFYRFKGPCAILPEAEGQDITWFVAADSAFASSQQLEALKALVPAPAKSALSPYHRRTKPEVLMTVCQVQ